MVWGLCTPKDADIHQVAKMAIGPEMVEKCHAAYSDQLNAAATNAGVDHPKMLVNQLRKFHLQNRPVPPRHPVPQ